MTTDEHELRTARSYKLIVVCYGQYDHDVTGLTSAFVVSRSR
jgi:hypothetical protein